MTQNSIYDNKLFNGFHIPKKMEYVQEDIHSNNLNKIYCKSSEDMGELPDNSVNLMITSSPYNVGKEYDDDLTIDVYRNLLTMFSVRLIIS